MWDTCVRTRGMLPSSAPVLGSISSPRSLFRIDGEEHRALLRTLIGLFPRMRALHPRPERMVVRGTVLVPHRSALVTVR
jgi:hypothetical protein